MDFATWLAHREAHDHTARHEPFTRSLVDSLPSDSPRVLDLATGRGSNLRYLRRFLPADTSWVVADQDPELLALIDVPCEQVQVDLRRGFDGLPEVDGIVCSALLDLVDHGFLVRLRDFVQARGVPFLVTLSVDGRLVWEHPDPDDAVVHAWYQEHQTTDRGFGPSVGVRAVPVLAELFSEVGLRAEVAESDWELDASETVLVDPLRDGIARSAAAMSTDPERVEAWRARREVLGGGLMVGHLDLMVLP